MRAIIASTLLLVLLSPIRKVFAQTRPNEKNIITEKLYINPEYAKGAADTQIFKRIVYLPLETTKESLFGEIYKMEITDKYYIISDLYNGSILLFEKTGKFFGKIDGKKLSNGRINPNFTVDREQNLIITTVSSVPDKLVWFDFKGTLVKQAPFKDEFRSIAHINSSLLVYSPFPILGKKIKRDSIDYFVKYLKNNVSNQKYFPFPVSQYALPEDFNSALGPMPYTFYYSGLKNNLLYVGNYDNNIFVLNDIGIQKIYSVIFPQDMSVSADSLARRLSVIDKEQYLRENDKKIYSFKGVYQLSDYLFFETVKRTFFNKNRFLFYNLKTRSVLALEKVARTRASSFLPLISSSGIVGCDGEYIYTSIPSIEMFQAMQATVGKHPEYPLVMQDYFKNQTRKSNPVLVLLKTKENL